MGFERKDIRLNKYAYYKYTGPYRQLKQIGQRMTAELSSRGIETSKPYIEMYGHWTDNEAELETELLMCIDSGDHE